MEPTRQVTTITVDTALKAVSIAIAEGQTRSVRVSVAVVDSALTLVAFARADGATPHSAETCRRKANTAASTGKATGWMNADLAISLPLASGGLLTNIGGGVPLRFNGMLAGGLGIAGGTVDQDKEIAAAVLSRLSADIE